MEQKNNEQNQSGQGATPFAQTYFHGTKANLNIVTSLKLVTTQTMGREKMRNTFFCLQH